MAKRFPIVPSHPERVCWGCDRYCPADAMICGNGTIRTPHPSELFGEDWNEWSPLSPAGEADADAEAEADADPQTTEPR